VLGRQALASDVGSQPGCLLTCQLTHLADLQAQGGPLVRCVTANGDGDLHVHLIGRVVDLSLVRESVGVLGLGLALGPGGRVVGVVGRFTTTVDCSGVVAEDAGELHARQTSSDCDRIAALVPVGPLVLGHDPDDVVVHLVDFVLRALGEGHGVFRFAPRPGGRVEGDGAQVHRVDIIAAGTIVLTHRFRFGFRHRRCCGLLAP